MRKSLWLLLIPLLMTACATEPLVWEGDDLAVENRDIGFRGYRLPLKNGYEIVSMDMAENHSVLQEWIRNQEGFYERVRVDPDIVDQVFLLKGNRMIWFAVEEVLAPIPFSRLAPDQRERLLRYMNMKFHQLASRYGETLPPFHFERLETREIVRTELLGAFPGFETMNASMMGGLNEIYHFYGVALEGEGLLLEKDILNMVRDLSF